jgi:hypothetical protein
VTPPHLPPDDESDYDEYIRRVAISAVGGYGNSNGAGARATNWLLTILSGLVLAEMLGGVVVYGKVEALQSTMNLIVEGKIVIVKVQDGHP